MTSRLLTRKDAKIALALGLLDEPSVVAGRNRVYDSGVASVATLTAPAALTGIFAVAVVQAHASGLFQVNASGTATIGAVEAGGVVVGLGSATPGTAGASIAVANATASTNGIYLTTGTTAATLSASSGSMNASIDQVQQNSLNGLASSATVTGFSLGGIFGSVAGNLPVAQGSYIAFFLFGQVATTTLTLSNFNFSVNELP